MRIPRQILNITPTDTDLTFTSEIVFYNPPGYEIRACTRQLFSFLVIRDRILCLDALQTS